MSGARRRHEALLALAIVVGLAAVVPSVHWLDAHRPAFKPDRDAAPVLTPATARRLSLGFNGLLADWYWLHTLQYIGRKIEEQAPGQRLDEAPPQLHRIRAVDPAVLARFFRELSRNIAMLVNTFNLDHVFLGGDIERYEGEIQPVLAGEIQSNWPYPGGVHCAIRFSSLGEKAVAYGAAGMVLHRLFADLDIAESIGRVVPGLPAALAKVEPPRAAVPGSAS